VPDKSTDQGKAARVEALSKEVITMEVLWEKVSIFAKAISSASRRRRRGCWVRIAGCLAIAVVLTVALVLALFALFNRASAQEMMPPQETLTVQLVIDNSNSMFDKGGIGSDPTLLRMDAARLFIEYLGVDDHRYEAACGLIFFGSEPQLISPPVLLVDADQRLELQSLLTEPARLGWTDQVKALHLAREALLDEEGRRAIVLLTDGKPEWNDQPTDIERSMYLEEMKLVGDGLARNGITLFLVLLANEGSDEDSEIESLWRPVWESMTTGTEDGRFIVVRRPQDLAEAYHDIVVSLTGRFSDGIVVDEALSHQGLREEIPVEPGLQRLTLVIQKSSPDTQITVTQPNEEILDRDTPPTGRLSLGGSRLEEIWTFSDPDPGMWVVTAMGEGRITVWKDYELAPVSPTRTPNPTQTPTVKSTATIAPTPSATVPQWAGLSTSVAPTPVATNMATATDVNREARSGWWLQALLALAVLTIAIVSLVRHRVSSSPTLKGKLNPIGANGQGPKVAAIDLYALGRSKITLGGDNADVRLPFATGNLTLQVRETAQGEPEVIALANPEILLNDRQLHPDQQVYDGDIFVIGPVRLRYDNVERRRPRHARIHKRPLGEVARNVSR
jgi:hypothetical protein